MKYIWLFLTIKLVHTSMLIIIFWSLRVVEMKRRKIIDGLGTRFNMNVTMTYDIWYMICDTGSLLLLVPRPTYRGRPVQKACPSYNFLSSYNLPTPPECVLRHPKIEHLHLPTSLRLSTPPVVSSRTRAPLPPEGSYSRCETLESIKVSIWATEVWRRRGSS